MTTKGSCGDGKGSIGGNDGSLAAETEAAAAAMVETIPATATVAKLRRLQRNVSCSHCR